MYDVSVLKGRLDRKIAHWREVVMADERIDATSQTVRDLTLWPLAVTDFKRDRRLFDLWAALAFWDHVDHQFGFIGHWCEWYFDFAKHAAVSEEALTPPAAAPGALPRLSSSVSLSRSCPPTSLTLFPSPSPSPFLHVPLYTSSLQPPFPFPPVSRPLPSSGRAG